VRADRLRPRRLRREIRAHASPGVERGAPHRPRRRRRADAGRESRPDAQIVSTLHAPPGFDLRRPGGDAGLRRSLGMSVAETESLALSAGSKRLAAFLELTKPRVTLMVLVTTFVGYYLGSDQSTGYARLVATLLGTALASGGTLALNQYMERDSDALMERTRRRPLPDGRILPQEALFFGAVVAAAGIFLLAFAVNGLSAAVTAAITVSYLFAYTPLKSRSALC